MGESKVEKVREKLRDQAYEMERTLRGARRVTRFPGLCGDCKFLELVRTQYGGIRKVWCDELDISLDPRDPVIECADYWKRGNIVLSDMVDQAVLLNIRDFLNESLYL